MKSNIILTIQRYSILLIAFLMPSAFYGATLVFLAIVFLCNLYTGDYKRVLNVYKSPQVLLPVLFYFYIAAGIFFTDHFGDGLSALSTRIAYLFFPVTIGIASVIDKRLLKQMSVLFIISTCISLVIAISYAAIDIVKTGESIVMLNEGIYGYNKFRSFGLTRVFNNWHPTNVSVCVNLAIALLALMASNVSPTKNRVLILVAFLFLSVCVFLLNSINGIITYAFVLLIFSFRFLEKYRYHRLIKAALIAFLFMIGFSIFYFNPLKNEKIESIKSRDFKITDKEGERNLLTIRLAKWDTHLDIFRNHWLWGTTAGDINYVRKDAYQKKGYESLAQLNFNAHNQYIEVLATHGLIGFLLFSSMLLIPLFQSSNNPYYLFFLLIVSITFITESLLNRQQGILFFMFLYSMYTHTNAAKEPIIAS